jgi:hypothetical protein
MLIDAIDENQTFGRAVEGMLIEVLRMVTFKIKVMDYIAKNAFDESPSAAKDLKKSLKTRI